MKHTINTITLSLPLFFACGGGDSHDGHDHGSEGEEGHDAHAEGPNGGEIFELGAHDAHLELVQAADGSVALHILGTDAKTPLAIVKAPELKLTGPDGPVLITAHASGTSGGKSHTWTVSAEELGEAELDGRVTIHIAGKVYNPTIHHHDDEGHDHDCEDHNDDEGHDHDEDDHDDHEGHDH